MSNYQKFSLQTIKERLKNGDYASLVGANRAIGKTQELSAGDKVKAKAMAAKHFGVDPQAPKAPKAAKKTAKRAKKVAKKVAKAAGAKTAGKRAKKTKKVAKKAAKASAKAGAAAPAPAQTPKARVSEAVAARVRQPAVKEKEPAKRETKESMSTMSTMGTVISTLSQALQSMETAKRLFPKADLEAGVVAAAGSMTRAVRVLDREVLSPLLPEDTKAAPAGGKNKGKKGKRPKAAAKPAAPAEESAAESDEEEAEEVDGTANGRTNLTPEELAEIEAAKDTQPESLRKLAKANTASA